MRAPDLPSEIRGAPCVREPLRTPRWPAAGRLGRSIGAAPYPDHAQV